MTEEVKKKRSKTIDYIDNHIFWFVFWPALATLLAGIYFSTIPTTPCSYPYYILLVPSIGLFFQVLSHYPHFILPPDERRGFKFSLIVLVASIFGCLYIILKTPEMEHIGQTILSLLRRLLNKY